MGAVTLRSTVEELDEGVRMKIEVLEQGDPVFVATLIRYRKAREQEPREKLRIDLYTEGEWERLLQ